MDIIQICPPKNLIFTLPTDLHRTLTITNLTLRSLYICILKSHEYEISLSQSRVMMSAFEELKLEITLNYNQEMINCSLAKLRIYYYQIDEEENVEEIEGRIFTQDNKTQFEEINILFDIPSQVTILHYQQITAGDERKFECKNQEVNNKSYLMRRVYPSSNKLGSAQVEEKLKNDIFNYLQHLSYVTSIEEYQKNHAFLIEFKETQEDICHFITFAVNQSTYVYCIARIIAYGKGYVIPTLVSIDSDDEQSSKTNQNIQKSPKKDVKSNAQPEQKEKQHPFAVSAIVNVSQSEETIPVDKKKRQLTKQSFAIKREGNVRTKRKNKSQQKIKELSEQSQDEQLQYRKQLRNMRMASNFDVKIPIPIKIRHQVKINETNIEMNEKILNVLIQNRENFNYIYVLVRDCVRIYILEDPSYKRFIKFDPIDSEHTSMPCPIDIYKDELIFGNESYLFWVHLQTGSSEWKYVQRKYLYALAVIEELSLVALGGKNFSKLSYFGKETSRSNIKFYSCSSTDKHDHLFTYDIPGNNVGHVINMAYITVPPLGTKLLLIQTVNAQSKSSFFFLRIKAFNKIEVYGELELDELGILNLLKFKYNKDTNRVVCMESLGNTQMDTFKKLKIKCQYEKVEVSTEGFKFPLKRFVSYHLGGSRESGMREWMSFVEENGSVFHLYDFESNKVDTFQLGKGEIRQVFSLYNGKYLIICSDTLMKIREKVEIQIRQ